jgi:hypothetical protein
MFWNVLCHQLICWPHRVDPILFPMPIEFVFGKSMWIVVIWLASNRLKAWSYEVPFPLFCVCIKEITHSCSCWEVLYRRLRRYLSAKCFGGGSSRVECTICLLKGELVDSTERKCQNTSIAAGQNKLIRNLNSSNPKESKGKYIGRLGSHTMWLLLGATSIPLSKIENYKYKHSNLHL